MSPNRLPTLPIVLVALAASAPAARAAESYDNCAGEIASLPATITTQGVWCVKGDLGTAIASGNAITVAANNVTIDCNDFKIGGLSAGIGTRTRGIAVSAGRRNATIRNCNIRGFFHGIDAGGSGGGHLIEDNRLEGNTNRALRVTGPAVVRNNFILDTGGSDDSTTTVAVEVREGTDLLENTIRGVVPSGTMPSVYGIQSGFNDHSLIRGNRLSGLVHAEGGATFTLAVSQTELSIVENNFLFGTGEPSTYGITCYVNNNSAVRNVIVGIAVPISNCTTYQNAANPN